MAVSSINPYLVLGGKAAEAIARYTDALGAKVQRIQRYGEARPDCPEELKDRVMHAVLEADGAILYLSDASPPEASAGGPATVAISFDDEARAHRAFVALAEGGKIIEGLAPAPWGGLYGWLQDPYGVGWMFTTSHGD